MANFNNYDGGKLLAGASDADAITNHGSNVTVDSGDGNDTIQNRISGHYFPAANVIIDTGAGNDSIYNDGANVSIDAGSGDDSIENSGTSALIRMGAGNDFITNGGGYVSIYAGAGNDTIRNYSSNALIIGGKGDDFISLPSYSQSNLIEYAGGDGFDSIEGFDENDTLSVSGSYSVQVDGSDVIITVGNGKIFLVGAANLEAVNINGTEVEMDSWNFSGTTATYGDLIIKGIKSLDGISLDGKVVTVSAASLGTGKVTVSDGYTLKLGSDVSGSTTKKSWTLSNSTATLKQTTSAGYKLSDNAITYSAKATKTLATVKGAKSKSGLSVSGSTVKLAASALAKKVTVSGAYTFDFAAGYSNATITGSSSADTIIARGENILLTGGKGADIFAVKPNVANVISDYAAEDKISLTSGAADFSVDGDDLIINGKISVTGAADKVVTYIDATGEHTFEADNSSLFSLSADGKAITLSDLYLDDAFNVSVYGAAIQTIDASAVVHELKITGNKLANNIIGTAENDYIHGQAGSDKIYGGAGDDTLLGGNGSDKLYGGAGNDSLWGGAGSDTLFGGDGKDVFVYKEGDGTVVIDDFTTLDKIRVLSGDVSAPIVDSAGDVTFSVGDGELIVKGGADKYIPIYDKGKNILMKHTPQ